MSMRLLVDDGAGAAEGLALDEALMAGCARDLPVPTPSLRLYTYRAHCGLVGRYQSLRAELDLERCAAGSTQVGRRATGGGAIIMGPDQLGVALVRPTPPRTPRQLIRDWAGGVVAGLARLGIDATFGGKNDLLVNDRKIAGLGVYTDGTGAALFHASVLADLDVDFMLQVLRIPAAKLARNGVSAVSERVTTVSRETGRRHSAADIRDAIAEGYAEALGVALVPSQVTAAERAAAAELVATRYAHDDWLFPSETAADGTGSATFRSPEGPVRVFVAAQGSLIKSVLFTGDFTTVPPALTDLEASLRWGRLEPGAVATAVRRVSPRAAASAWDDPESVVTAVLTAGERAHEHAIAHPQRTSGSCYFPDAS
jgi:lipoate-protein ligase A